MAFLAFFVYYFVGALPNYYWIEKGFKVNLNELLSRRPNYLMFSSVKSVLVILTLMVTDFAKGIIPLYAGYLLGFTNLELSYLVIALILGHYYPVFNYFQGRLGMMVCIASYTTLGWSVMFVASGIWLVTYLISGYRVVANVLVALFIPVYIYFFLNVAYIIPVVTLSSVIILRHTALLIRTRYGYYLPDCNGLFQRLVRDKDFLI
ncbi:glycerol-3-phosphate acyltransferase [Psittacicella hinzii]|uniref:Glycerol-3-phosphate acyltransferase n=1 Tax=Psittacicella hinzii TaxID=2028575 RepID=A0A3A1YC86_9GAMM|nr:glycerol-3-phosphate acyltransferase [Psittacicella hinzii]RIY34986.1 hypothetical protein CKF58_07235 [Psittacicella hinzii]